MTNDPVSKLSQHKAQREFQDWYHRHYRFGNGDESVPLFDTETVERNSLEIQVVNKHDFHGRDVLARSEDMKNRMHLEMMACLIKHAYTQDSPREFIESKFGEIRADWDIMKKAREVIKGDRPGTITFSVRGDSRKIHVKDGLQIGGILYMMHTVEKNQIIPLYIGITQLENIGGYLNSTMNPNSDSKFGRWGYARNQHLGELGNVVFDYDWKVSPKYQRWADTIFIDRNRVLRKPLFFWLQTWDGDIHEAEEWIIKLASRAYPDKLLNTQHAIYSENRTLEDFRTG